MTTPVTRKIIIESHSGNQSIFFYDQLDSMTFNLRGGSTIKIAWDSLLSFRIERKEEEPAIHIVPDSGEPFIIDKEMEKREKDKDKEDKKEDGTKQ